MNQSIVHIALVVNDYDEAIKFYTEKLNFTHIEDTSQSETERWVKVAQNASEECCRATSFDVISAGRFALNVDDNSVFRKKPAEIFCSNWISRRIIHNFSDERDVFPFPAGKILRIRFVHFRSFDRISILKKAVIRTSANLSLFFQTDSFTSGNEAAEELLSSSHSRSGK
jgi:catechol 2,3-dioxygenase-like lactoylglutathione lyase family enzyme